jgi:hypothetical protein
MIHIFCRKTSDAVREVVANFGDARLVRRADGSYDIVGGTEHDHLAAQEWVGLFLHEAVIGPRRSS